LPELNTTLDFHLRGNDVVLVIPANAGIQRVACWSWRAVSEDCALQTGSRNHGLRLRPLQPSHRGAESVQFLHR